MECANPNIPKYLDRNNRQPLSERKFFYFHNAYRDEANANGIEIPGGNANAISCKWSKLIRKEDIHKVEPFKPSYRFCFFKEIRKLKLERDYLNGQQHQGRHVLTAKIVHTPQPCNFAHIEILINHKIFDIKNGKKLFEETYTYLDWKNKNTILNGNDNKFFKGLRGDYRIEVIKLISRASSENNLKNNTLAIIGIL